MANPYLVGWYWGRPKPLHTKVVDKACVSEGLGDFAQIVISCVHIPKYNLEVIPSQLSKRYYILRRHKRETVAKAMTL